MERLETCQHSIPKLLGYREHHYIRIRIVSDSNHWYMLLLPVNQYYIEGLKNIEIKVPFKTQRSYIKFQLTKVYWCNLEFVIPAVVVIVTVAVVVESTSYKWILYRHIWNLAGIKDIRSIQRIYYYRRALGWYY